MRGVVVPLPYSLGRMASESARDAVSGIERAGARHTGDSPAVGARGGGYETGWDKNLFGCCVSLTGKDVLLGVRVDVVRG